MADDVENDDQWLYGENEENSQNLASQEPEPEEKSNSERREANFSEPLQPPGEDGPPGVDAEEFAENKRSEENKDVEEEEDGEVKQNGDDSDRDLDDEDDDSDDDVNVVIGDIKTTPTYTSLNIKRGGLLTTSGPGDKNKQTQQPGKFNVEEFDQLGLINGIPAADFNLDSLEDKPWRKPGADITDYFNYGFNEDTWKAYCERQKRLRMTESGVGLAPMNAIGLPRGPMLPIMNDNSKYSGNFLGNRKAGPPPGRRMTGTIDVIVGAQQQKGFLGPGGKPEPPKENVIQVMTADRREYSRKPPGFPDMSVPPPAFDDFNPGYDFNPEPEPFYGGYEPTQDMQWGGEGTNPSGWVPSADVKSLTPGPQPVGPPPHMMGPPMGPPMRQSPPRRDSPHRDRERDRDRDRDRERDRESRSRSEKPRDRERERSHRRERSRSRSRRHKSRSRSPSHRSHRKKKSKRHEDSD